jgi:hypothetical protein
MSPQMQHFRRFAVPVAALIVGLCFIGEFTAQGLVKTFELDASSLFTEVLMVPVPQISLPRDSANDWFQVDRFESEAFLKNSCTFVENVCHSSGRWWYDEKDRLARQPEFTLRTELRGAPGYPETINVRASDDKRMSNRTCPYSPTPNHLVLHGMHNHKMEQFYVRVLAGLSELVRTQVDDMVDFLQQTQLYLHLYEKNDKPIQDSHYIFTDAFRARQLHDFKSLLDASGCMCHKRLILCGYEEKDDGKDDGKKEEKMIVPGEGLLQPDKAWGPEAYQTLRQTTLRQVILGNHHMQADIKEYRRKALWEKKVKDDLDEWKVIGLAQRNEGSPRRWANLKRNKDGCNHFMKRHKIICAEVNIEDKKISHPYQQAVMHGALDGLIGIHGAELTEAVWMKPGSLVVEFLPWLHPEVNESKSVRSVKEVTPLGVIFSESDLNHVGFPLDRASAPFCEGQDTNETKCWQDHPWDSREFVGTDESIVDALTMFLVANPAKNCAEYQELATDKYVLYNIHCKTGNETVPSLQHFFWEKDLFDIPNFAR